MQRHRRIASNPSPPGLPGRAARRPSLGMASSLEQVWQARDAAAALEEWASHLARFHPRVLAVARAVQRVRRTDPDAAAQWVLVMADQQACCHRLAIWLAREQRLAPPWTVQTATDMLWALMSYELLEELMVDRGWSAGSYRTHLPCSGRHSSAAPVRRRHLQPPTAKT